ncbi:MAG: DUF4143 domain-containing protein [Bacteroidales bacterium]|nr:DUF4143 domain-containing protein [Bacteroidales bacterium]
MYINEGMLMENIVAQMFTAKGHNLYFYSKHSDNAQERMEIDFLLAKSRVTSRHNIIPIEVKSGKNYTFSSLKKIMERFRDFVATPVVMHTGDLKTENGVEFLPVYMTSCL